MKTLRVSLVCVVFVVLCFVDRADAQYKWGGFFLGTLGVHTVNGTAFGGLTGFYGGSKNNTGLGLMGSYEVGGRTVYGYDMRLQIVNVYFSATYTLGQSTFIASQGVSTVIASVGDEREDFSGSTTAISYLFHPTGKRFIFFGQARLQGQGLMLAASVGF